MHIPVITDIVTYPGTGTVWGIMYLVAPGGSAPNVNGSKIATQSDLTSYFADVAVMDNDTSSCPAYVAAHVTFSYSTPAGSTELNYVSSYFN